MSDLIKYFCDIGEEDMQTIGTKGVNQAFLASVGFSIPPGFCITTRAYQAFLHDSGLDQAIASMIAHGDLTVYEQIQDCGRVIRQMIMEHKISEKLKEVILPAYWQLFLLPSTLSAKGRDWKLYVTVKSSITSGDLPATSCNGWHDSYLKIFGHADLLCSIKKCWAFLWADQAIAYRQEHHIDQMDSSMAVVVQQMLPPETACTFLRDDQTFRIGALHTITA